MSTSKRAPLVMRELYKRLRAIDALATPMAIFDQAFRANGFLRTSGWLESYRRHMPTSGGQPIPFYTYPAIAFLAPRIDNTMTVFEYGCGNSTLWWAARAKTVTAVEHDRGWLETMRVSAPANVKIIHHDLEPNGLYSKQGAAFASDIIVVDGRDRVSSAKNCLPGLTARGVIVWDNSDRARYQDGYDFLIANGFRRLDFVGPGPVLFETWSTSVFYRGGNCLGI